MVGIVILDYNNAADTINCIESVVSKTRKGTYKLVVVENGSKQEVVDEMKCYAEKRFSSEDIIICDESCQATKLPLITLLVSKTNDGYAKGNNKALHILSNDEEIDAIMILNNDILFTEDITMPLYGYLRKLPGCGIVSPLLKRKDGLGIDYNCARKDYKRGQFFWEYLFSFKDLFGIIAKYEHEKCYLLNNPKLLEKEYFEMELPSGSCMLIDKKLFSDIGYFDEGTFLYFEENILYRKLLLANKKNYLIPSLSCIHLGASTSKKISSMFTMSCQMKSTAYYLRKYRKANLLAAYVDVMSYMTTFKIWLQTVMHIK